MIPMLLSGSDVSESPIQSGSGAGTAAPRSPGVFLDVSAGRGVLGLVARMKKLFGIEAQHEKSAHNVRSGRSHRDHPWLCVHGDAGSL